MNKDDELMELLRHQETSRKGFRMLVDMYGERLYWQIRHLVFNHEDANDVLQNTFTKAWLNLEKFEGKSKIFTWLSRIAINEALDHLRRNQRLAEHESEENPLVASRLEADGYFDGDEIELALHQAVETLPEVQRKVFILRYFQEMKYSDMSELLRTSEGALKSSYHIAVEKIQRFIRSRD